jgi:GT2 family glycosyltransferase
LISIVIPVFNGHEMTQDCVKSIRDNTSDCEIVIVDNGSFPAETTRLNGTTIRNEKNLGFPVAINQGIKAAKGGVIILLNNDTIVTPGWAEKLMAHFDKYDIVGPMTNYCAGLQRVFLPTYNDDKELYQVATQWANDHAGQSVEVNFIIGFCMAFKKSLYDDLGSFDESLWPCSGEEIDFCLRARDKGFKVGIAKDVYIHHEGSQTFRSMDVDYAAICERNDSHLKERWGYSIWGNQSVLLNETKGVRLNMGSGPFPLKGFINIDQFEHVHPDLICDCTKLPYEPESVDEIYAGHVLEHFHYADGVKALGYWISLLKHGGKISVTVPDYDYLVKAYAANPSPEKLMEFNDTYIYSGIQPSPHLYAYSADLLKRVMENAGLIEIKRLPVNHPYFPEAVLWQVGFEGVKP